MGLFSPSTEKVNILTHGQDQNLTRMNNLLFQNLGNPGPQYNGPMVPGMDSLQQSAISQAPSVMGMNPNISSALNQVLGGVGGQQEVNDMFRSSLGPARREFEDVLRNVGHRYGSTNGGSGALMEMAGDATANYGGQLNQLLGRLTYEDRQSNANRALQGVTAGIGVENQENANLASLFGMGDARRSIQGQLNQGQFQDWQQRQWTNNPALGLISPALGTQKYALTQEGGELGAGLGAVTGAITSGAGLYSMFQ